ncbi:MAG: (2Fe-2S)-binding protein [Sphingobium sp.]|jgi:aerobic-type carbon monoxide dehydrogenase small subunit (CoxS/CutS family)|nr:(2Fe-2S)-binding protein [Alphaproteobacteria bacterium]MCI1756620.1 (2Fe-2S)-binding protein [Sphingobium sp.]|tara:strand:+ start:94 stop:594 length:501 start_codon:yes stop_codon:yes gene_type:complete
MTDQEGQLPVRVTLNGQPASFLAAPRTSLSDALRDKLRLTGLKQGCEIGVCGSCTILVDDKPIRACLMLAVQADGKRIETIEGLATNGELHPLQASFQRHHGLQCGFCTSGMVLTALALLRDNPAPSRDEAREAISGNLCRCTGYETIIDAIVDPDAMRATQVGHG